MPQYKVIYFDARGAAEPIRQMLSYAGEKFIDERVSHESLTPERKIELGLVDWGQLPALEVDGEIKCQSHAIYRYLAKKLNLAGQNEWEEYRCDEIIEAIRDFAMKLYPVFGPMRSGDTEKFEELKKKFAEVDAPPHLERFNKIIEKSEHGWLVGNALTYADINFVNAMSYQRILNLELTKPYPAIEKLINTVETQPKLKEWFEKRPKTQY